jgi:hypothetical protein
LQQNVPGKNSPLLYFYFDFNEPRKQTLDGLLRSLIWQLAGIAGGHPKELEELCKACRNCTDQPSTQALARTFEKMLERIIGTTIILDALDECTSKPDLLQWISRVAHLEIACVQIVTTSRREGIIEATFEKSVPKGSMIPILQHEVDRDICTYVRASLRTDSRFERWRGNRKVLVDIEAKLTQKSAGM